MSGVLRGTIRQGWVAAVSLAFSGVLALLVAWHWERAKSTGNNKEFGSMMFAAAVGASLLGSTHLHPHDLTLMLLPTVVVTGSPGWAAKLSNRWFITFAIAILYAVPLYYVRWGPPFVLAPALLTFVVATLSFASRVRKGALAGENPGQTAVASIGSAGVTG
jgi:hypothetical protein